MTDLLSVITEYLPFLESCVFLNTSEGQSLIKIVQDQTIYIYVMDFRQMQTRSKPVGNLCMPTTNKKCPFFRLKHGILGQFFISGNC